MRNIKIHAIPVRKGRAAFYIGNGSISGNNISSHLRLRFFLPLIMGISLISCSNKNKSGAAGAYGKLPPASVTVYMATPAIHQITERFPGTLIANSIVQLRPDVTGYLEAIRVPDGSFVKRGQVLGSAAPASGSGNGEIELQVYRNMAKQNPEHWIRRR